MIVSPTPVTPSSVSTTTSAAVRSQRSFGTQNGSPVQGAVTRTVRTAVTRTGRCSVRGVDDEIARDGRDVGDAAHPGVLGEALAQVVQDARNAIGSGEGHAPQDRSGDHDGPCPERQGDQDVAAAAHPTVEVDLGPPG